MSRTQTASKSDSKGEGFCGFYRNFSMAPASLRMDFASCGNPSCFGFMQPQTSLLVYLIMRKAYAFASGVINML
jgi:hypothetical protein